MKNAPDGLGDISSQYQQGGCCGGSLGGYVRLCNEFVHGFRPLPQSGQQGDFVVGELIFLRF